jgi:hypothetical protein
LEALMPKRDWTILLYSMADQHALRVFANDTLLDISHASGYCEIKTVAQVTFHSSVVDPIRRYDFEYRSSTTRKTDLQNKLQFMPQKNLGPRANLIAFLKWGQRRYPAKRFGVVLQGHAWGADYTIPSLDLTGETTRGSQHARYRLIFGSPRSKNHLSNKDLQDALTDACEGRKFDLLGMDSCLMSMAEICYELRRCAHYTLAPEGLGPVKGWPFYPILMGLNENPSVDASKLGDIVLERYSARYADWGGSMKLTISLCSLNYSADLMRAMIRFVSLLAKGLQDHNVFSAIVRARVESPHYLIPTYVDLRDFCRLLMREPAIRSQSSLYDACRHLRTVLTHKFVQRVALKRGRTNSFGLSIYFPAWRIRGNKQSSEKTAGPPWTNAFGTPRTFREAISKIEAAYVDHEFADKSGWKKFLVQFLERRLVIRRQRPAGINTWQ